MQKSDTYFYICIIFICIKRHRLTQLQKTYIYHVYIIFYIMQNEYCMKITNHLFSPCV